MGPAVLIAAAAKPQPADSRFQALLGPAAWSELPTPVRRRFSKRLAGTSVVYTGQVVEIWASRAGCLLAQAARLIGAPLPLVREAPAPSVVTVTENATGGQVWTRLYARRLGFPQVVHSTKRFKGPTGLEEHVGGGIGMALTAGVEDGVLTFRSAHYFIAFGRFRLRLPRALEPGEIAVAHTELGDGRFSFTLDVRHPRLGRIIHQRAVFQEDHP